MKILSWNCNGALRKKLDDVNSFDADIVVIQECENPSESDLAYQNWSNQYLWTGEGKNKGIGVFVKKGHKISDLKWNGTFEITGLKSNSSSLKWHSSELKLFLPFMLNDKYIFLAVWTKGKPNQVFDYIGQFWKYLQIHRTDLANKKTIILGDFNSNAIWDRPDRWWNHSEVIKELSEMGINSVYHYQFRESQGHESIPTFYLHRNEAKPYHIDYIFVSDDLIESCKLSIGEKSNWLSKSDHMPLFVDID